MERITKKALMQWVVMSVAAFVGTAMTGCSTQESVTGAVSAGNVRNSGCQQDTRGTSVLGNPTLKLTRVGDDLQAEFHDYRLNCAYKDAKVTCSAKDGVLDITVEEVIEGNVYANCVCPVNIYFTIYNANESVYKLRINQEDLGVVSFQDHNVTEIDLWNHEQAHEEGFDYPILPSFTYALEISPQNLEGREDKLPEINFSHHGNELGIGFQFFRLPKEFENLCVEGEAKGDTITMTVITDGVISQDSPRRGSASCTFQNASATSYYVEVMLQSKVKGSDGGYQVVKRPVFVKQLDMPSAEQERYVVRTNVASALVGRWQYKGSMIDSWGGLWFQDDGTVKSWIYYTTGSSDNSDWGTWWTDENGDLVLKTATPSLSTFRIASLTDEELVIREYGERAGIPFEEDKAYQHINQ